MSEANPGNVLKDKKNEILNVNDYLGFEIFIGGIGIVDSSHNEKLRKIEEIRRRTDEEGEMCRR